MSLWRGNRKHMSCKVLRNGTVELIYQRPLANCFTKRHFFVRDGRVWEMHYGEPRPMCQLLLPEGPPLLCSGSEALIAVIRQQHRKIKAATWVKG